MTLTLNEMVQAVAHGLGEVARKPNAINYVPLPKQLEFHRADKSGRLYTGGNRAGKTVAGVIEDYYWLSGKHPFLDTPEPPVHGRLVTVDFLNGMDKIILPVLKQWIPPSELKNGSWEDSFNRDKKLLTLRNGSRLEIMSHEQPLEKFAGTARHFLHIDEECPKPIFTECKSRLVDYNGYWWFTMTPVEGMCVDDRTQLLSQRGWLYWYELKTDDTILTHLGWKRLQALYVDEDYCGSVHTFGGLDAVATRGHKWMTQRGLISENEILTSDKIKISVDIDNLFPSQYSEDFVELIGWIVGDGTIPNDSNTKVILYQSEKIYPENCAIIRRILDSVGARWFERNNEDRVVFGIMGEIGRDIRRVIGDKKVLSPQWVSSLNKKLLKALERGLVGADGTIKPSGTREITTIRKDHAEMYEMVGVLAGYRVSSGKYGKAYKVRYWKKEQSPKGFNKKVDFYSGVVWCPNTEAGTFVAKRNGSIYLTGNTWVYEDYVIGTPDSVHMVNASIGENIYLSDRGRETLLADLSESDRRIRGEGEFIPKGGLVLREFDYSRNVIEAGTPPRKWTWYVSIDAGYNNPTAILWHAVRPEDGSVVTFAEHYMSEWTIKMHADKIKEMNTSLSNTPSLYVGDPAMAQRQQTTGLSILVEYMQNGLPVVPGSRDVSAGLNKMNEYFRQSKWYITKDCPNLLREIKQYRWKTYTSPKLEDLNNKREEPHKKNDHAIDSSRYFFTFMPNLKPMKMNERRAPDKQAIAAIMQPGTTYNEKRLKVYPWQIDPNLENLGRRPVAVGSNELYE